MAYNVLTGSGIKSIVRSTPQALTGVGADGGAGTIGDYYYKDITITAVDSVSKTIVNHTVSGIYSSSIGILGYAKLTSTTNLRIYYLFDCDVYYEIIELY